MSLPSLLTERELFPRERLKKQLLNSLINGNYPFEESQTIKVRSIVLTMELDYVEKKYLLSGDTAGTIRVHEINDCDYHSDFLTSVTEKLFANHHIIQAQWYPVDTGMFSFAQHNSMNLVDTNQMEIVNSTEFKEQRLYDTDWNRLDHNLIAMACSSSQVRLFDVRTADSLTTIIVNSTTTKNYHNQQDRKIYKVLWSPLDRTGLLVGNDHGDIFFYDIRKLKVPLGRSQTDHTTFLPVMYLGMTVDNRKLITSHGVNSTLNLWNFYPDKENFLQNCNVNFSSGSKKHSSKIPLYIKLEIFATEDYIFVPNQFRSGPDVKCYDIRNGMELGAGSTGIELRNPAAKRPIYSVTGYRGTKFGNDPNPALIYSGSQSISVFRMNTYSEPFEDEALNDLGTRHRNLHKDRWSDSD